MPAPTVHATAVLVGEAGVLIRGPSGSGKSSLALALLALPGARLVADDRCVLTPASGRLLAAPAPVLAGLIEIRGQGIVRRPFLAPVVIRLVVDLVADRPPRLPDEAASRVRIAAIDLPVLTLAARTPDGHRQVQAALRRETVAEEAVVEAPLGAGGRNKGIASCVAESIGSRVAIPWPALREAPALNGERTAADS